MKYQTFKFLEYGFKIDYHPHWNIGEYPGTLLALLSPLVGPEDQYRKNLNITREALPNSSMSLEYYVNLSIEQLKEGLTNFRLLESSSAASFVRGKAHKLIYNGTSGIFYLKFMQIFTMMDNFVYILTYTAENNHYEEFFNDVKKMIKSFRPI